MTPTPDAHSMRHGVIVLAAGISKRLGRPKALIEIDGETLVHRAVRMGLATDPSDCMVVSAIGGDAIVASVADLDCRVVPCVEAARGISASLQCGIRFLRAHCAAALIILVDQPALSAPHLCALRDAWRHHPERAAASGYASIIGVPAMLPRDWFEQLIGSNGDQGARDLLRSRLSEVSVISAPQLVQDIDTQADLEWLQSTRSPKSA